MGGLERLVNCSRIHGGDLLGSSDSQRRSEVDSSSAGTAGMGREPSGHKSTGGQLAGGGQGRCWEGCRLGAKKPTPGRLALC